MDCRICLKCKEFTSANIQNGTAIIFSNIALLDRNNRSDCMLFFRNEEPIPDRFFINGTSDINFRLSNLSMYIDEQKSMLYELMDTIDTSLIINIQVFCPYYMEHQIYDWNNGKQSH